METQNITLSLPKEILQKAKLLAVRRQTSVSSLLAGELEKLVRKEEAYAYAKQRSLLLMEKGLDLATYGKLDSDRDELHER